MMVPDVVVGVDAAPPSRAAVDAGLRLARAGGGRCRLIHAVADARLPAEVVGAGVALDVLHLAERARIRAEVSTALAEGGVVPADVIGELEIRTGRAASVLDAVVHEMDAGLMVLGGKHHSALGRWLGGSTVQQAVRRLNVPLLVTTKPLPDAPRILVAVDRSLVSARTVQSALTFAALLGGSLRALHVLEPTQAIIEAGLLPELRRRVERDIWPLFPVPDSQKVIRHGVPGEAIAEEADAWHADVIVVGSHGKGWVDRLLLGSVTEELLNDLPAAVLVIPVPPPEQSEAVAARAFRAAEA
jgi:nucleotide-binding universal stress UspA family protein